MSSYGLWLSAAGMKISGHKQTLIANNLANAETTGFKRDLAVVLERPVESREGPGGMPFVHPVLDGMGGGVNVRPTFHDFSPGPIEHTGRPLDVALDGEGFLTVSDGKTTRYTRDGVMTVNRRGELVLSSGGGRWRVLDESGSPIVFQRGKGAVTILPDGTVRQGKTAVGKLARVRADDPQAMRKVGENLFEIGDAKMSPSDVRIVPEAREGANVEVVSTLATMIEAARAYQLNATMIQMQDELTGQVLTVGRPV